MRVRFLTGVTVAAFALAASPAHAADAPGTLLDAVTPLAIAASGGDVAWLRPTDTAASVLVFRRAGGQIVTVDAPMPEGANGLALGSDATGALTAVVATGADPSGAPSALYRVAASADAAPQLLSVSSVAGAEFAPGLRAGRLSFVRATDAAHGTVQLGTLLTAASRKVSGGTGAVIDTAPGLGGRVAVTSRRLVSGTAGGFTDQMSVLKTGVKALALGSFATDTSGGNVGGVGPLTVDRSGTVAAFSRPGNGKGTRSGTGGGRAYWRFSTSSGKRVSQGKLPGDRDVVVPLVGGGYAGYDTDRLAGTPTGYVDGANRCAPVGPRDCALYLLG